MSAVTVVIGAGSGQAIARRVSAGRLVLLADLRQGNTTFATWKLMHLGRCLVRWVGPEAVADPTPDGA